MTSPVPELNQRRKTDKYLSFGVYIIIILILIGLLLAVATFISKQWGWYFLREGRNYFNYRFSFPFGYFLYLSGWILTLLITILLLSIVFWWYQWQLYKRRNEHIERIKSLKKSLSWWIKEKYNIELHPWTGSEIQLSLREQKRSTGFFLLWIILSYIFNVVGFALTIVSWYWLTIDYYVHEQGEIQFFHQVSRALGEKGISFNATVSRPVPPRNMVLYIILMIIPGVNLGWAVWWSYILFKDPNNHFKTHEFWEEQLERIIAAESIHKAPPSSQSPLEILKRRYAQGEITREEFQRMKEDLEK